MAACQQLIAVTPQADTTTKGDASQLTALQIKMLTILCYQKIVDYESCICFRHVVVHAWRGCH